MKGLLSSTLRRHALPYDRTPIGGALWQRLGAGDVPTGLPLLDCARPPRRDEPATVDRALMTQRLVEYNASVGNPLGDEAVDALRTNGWLIVAGQQPGLLLGPLYTVYKAVTVLRLCRCMSSDALPLVPAFWVASEDHDLAEVDHYHVGSHEFRADHNELRNAAQRPPVGGVSLRAQRDAVIADLQQHLPPTADRRWVIDAVAQADFTNYATLFTSLFVQLFGEGRFVLIDPMRLRDVLAPALAQVVDRLDAAHEAFARGGERLRAEGFEPQLEKLTLFEIVDGVRRPVRDKVGGDDVRREPERYSAGAGLRPIVQDNALPVAATVGGPSEMLYQWQIDGLYDAVGLTRSALWPRLSATWVDRFALNIAERLGLSAERLFEVCAAHDRAGALDSDLSDIEAMGDELSRRLGELDDGRNRKLIARARRSIAYQVRRVLRRVQADRLNDAGRGERDRRTLWEAIMPGGAPQERVMNVFELIARHGRGALDQWIESADPTTIAHEVVVVQGEET